MTSSKMVSYPWQLCLVRASLLLNTSTQEEAHPGKVIPRLDLVCFPVFHPLHVAALFLSMHHSPQDPGVFGSAE